MTKLMLTDFRPNQTVTSSSMTAIREHPLRTANTYQYLTLVDRLIFLTKLVLFYVNCKMLKMFDSTFVENVLTSCFTCCFIGITEARKNTLRKLVTTACKMLGISQNNLEHVYKQRSLNKAKCILVDYKHRIQLLLLLYCYPECF